MPERLIAELKNLTMRLEQTNDLKSGTQFTDPLTMVQLAVTMHRERERIFPTGYFADTSWEILLDLFIAKRDARKMIVSDLCLDAKIPPTTVLRHLMRLVEDGFVRRVDDPFDRRKSYVQLTEHGSNKIIDVFQHASTVHDKQMDQRAKSVIIN